MSIESMSIAINHSRATGTARLVLMGIANHDGDGGAWPAIQTLQRYAGGVDRRNVQRALDKLEELGEIRRVIQQGGDHSVADHRRPNRYLFLLRCPHDCDRSANHRTARTPELMVDGVAVAPPHGDSAAGTGGGSATQTVLLNPDTSPLVETSPLARARDEDVCDHGHPLIAISGGGEPFCELGHYRAVVPA